MVKKETGMNSMIRVLAVLLLAVGSLSAADRPNLSGTWKANLDKSDYGPVPPPTSFANSNARRAFDFVPRSAGDCDRSAAHGTEVLHRR